MYVVMMKFFNIFVDGADRADKGQRISIPSERAQEADIGELDVIHYRAGGEEESDKQSQKTASVKAGLVIKVYLLNTMYTNHFKKVQVGNDQEKAQSEKRFPLHKPRGGKKLYSNHL